MTEKAWKRFWSKVDKNGPVPEHRPELGPCWLWTGYLNHKGYAYFSINKKSVRAHRWLYKHLVGSIADELLLDHVCRTRHCVRHSHVEPVTNRENTLRGNGITAINAKKTHCDRGHPLSGENLVIYRGRRICLTCKRMHSRLERRRRAAKREAA